MTVIQNQTLNNTSLDRPDLQNFETHRSSAAPDTGSIYVVLPAYNEEGGLSSLLGKLRETLEPLDRPYQIIVVDDASTDDTSGVARVAAEEMPVELVRHPKNCGLSGALETGFRSAMKVAMPGDLIITMDADDTHGPATINRMLLMIEEGYDVVIASRYQVGSRVVGVPPSRLLMTWFARHLFKFIMPIKGVRDYTCGYRAYRFNVLKTGMDYYGDEFVSEQGFSCMVDVLLKLRRFKFVMGEVPMLLRYDQKQGSSKMQVSRTASKTIKLLVKRRLAGY